MLYAVSLLLSLVFGPCHCIPQVFDAVRVFIAVTSVWVPVIVSLKCLMQYVSILLLLMFGSLSLYLSSV